ncbi:hypothetical protein EGW08_011250 [Elysia chlorotica]|uniref:N-acetyltransferase domain-containing protein n=1 Tax=Elysia chlorotica TaxID=188477 RepID=A0A433THB5_ELYCH|nr:hypothetical protein EGW08_011250 [Elysia chlorotica]
MDGCLHHVTTDELPDLRDWLVQYLPDSFKIYSVVKETINGRWQGTSLLTLGWPNILAVGEGPTSSQDIECAQYFNDPPLVSVFSPSHDHLKQLLTAPGYLDWTKPILFHFVCTRNTTTIQEVSESRGGNPQRAYRHGIKLIAKSGDIPLLPVPDGFEARALDPDTHTDLILSRWHHARKNADLYIRETLRRFPSVGLFDKRSGMCVAHEMGTKNGTIGRLYVHEDYRRRGLGKLTTSLLANQYFSQGLDVAILVFATNTLSLDMHSRMGFKVDGDGDFYTHYIGNPEDHEDILNFG